MTSAIVSGSGRKGRKRSRPAAPSFGWKPVEVTIGDVVPAGSVDVTSDNGDAMASNHYDDDSFAHRASRDLEAEPGEGVGMFYGLEVISGDQYRMITTPHSEGSDPSSITRLLVVNSPDVTTNDVDKNVQTVRKQETPARNKSKKTKKQGDTASQNPNCAPSETRSTEPSATAGRTVETCKHSKSGPVDLTTARNGKISSKALEDDQQSDTGRSVAEGSQGRQRSQQQAQAMQDAWLMQTGGVSLDLAICEALVLQSFWTPTPIQAATLPAAILGRRNVVGAAPTGSGKTLAFLLPVAQFLLQKQESMHINDEATKDNSLQALIVTPTRELALQIHREAVSFLSSSIKKNSGCGVLVGGLAHAKQSRVLASRPPILVATPGRLWELLSSGEHAHLNDLSRVRFLIIDEADRMIQQGSFPQLARILDAVQKANPTDDDDEEELGEEGTDITEEDGDTNRLFGLPGIPGEAKVTMLNASILQQIEEVKNGSKSGPPVVEEICSGEEDVEAEGFEGGSDDGSDPISLPGLPPVYRQTFVYSATLTLPSSGSALQSKKKKRARSNKDVDGAIAEILEKSRAKGTTKVVDLSHLDKRDKAKSVPITAQTDDRSKANAIPAGPAGQFRLPPGLTLQQIKCTQRHKDSHLYAYLLTTDAGASGPSLVFCNSIAAVRRVGATMQTLGLQVRVLHAQMQQRARFKAIEYLRNGKERTVVVCTDVAARGLDIPSVASVVHYDVARTVDSFVHRSGRTARGMGPGAVGSSLSLVAPSEDRIHGKIVESLQAKFESVNLDGRLFKAAQERVNLACKVVETEETERKTQQSNKWFLDNAEEVGIELDEDVFEEGLAGGDKRDRGRLREGQLAKERLQKLLAEPMQTQRFCKFLSTRTASNHRSIAPSLPQAGGNQARRNKKRRRN